MDAVPRSSSVTPDRDAETSPPMPVCDKCLVPMSVGTFRIELPGHEPAIVDVYSNVIVDDEGTPAFRLAALVDVRGHATTDREELENRIREKDMLLNEIQHRVKNSLQMIP